MKYALYKDRSIIKIKDSSNGKGCECVCKCCGQPVVAKQGKVKDWHFAHLSKIECKYSNNPAETDLHILAKSVIEKHKTITIDSVFHFHKEVLKKTVIKFDRIELEKRVDKFTPDIIAYKGSEKIWVEIAVTHFTDENKINYCKENHITLVEYDLSSVNRNINEKDLINYMNDLRISNQLLWSSRLFDKVNDSHYLNFNKYDDLKYYIKNGRCEYFLNFSLDDKIDKEIVKKRIETLEKNAWKESFRRVERSKKYIENNIKDCSHLRNWLNNEMYKRYTKEHVHIQPHFDLLRFVLEISMNTKELIKKEGFDNGYTQSDIYCLNEVISEIKNDGRIELLEREFY